ncbi:hypothetical protein PHAMO_380009 [Magnetospirillum molischianum DSM 120]|uniref:Uncharacterized protein n=1 Tax=Magnetospirillum molischianum DSM 120 TaxID=1150626 RepID=H8FVF3_MAGML|nr:hypothetical protein PHAMO_380009 [Magnetospirillum molischianum DSM 120]
MAEGDGDESAPVMVVDNGASTFVPLCSYLLQNEVIPLLAEAGHGVRFHTVITGGLRRCPTPPRASSACAATSPMCRWWCGSTSISAARFVTAKASKRATPTDPPGPGPCPGDDPGGQAGDVRPRHGADAEAASQFSLGTVEGINPALLSGVTAKGYARKVEAGPQTVGQVLVTSVAKGDRKETISAEGLTAQFDAKGANELDTSKNPGGGGLARGGVSGDVGAIVGRHNRGHPQAAQHRWRKGGNQGGANSRRLEGQACQTAPKGPRRPLDGEIFEGQAARGRPASGRSGRSVFRL